MVRLLKRYELILVLSRVGVTYKTVLDLMIGFIAFYTITQFGTTGKTALFLLYTLSSSVFTSRILVTDLAQPLSLQITHEVFAHLVPRTRKFFMA
jgi:hypothetical protein